MRNRFLALGALGLLAAACEKQAPQGLETVLPAPLEVNVGVQTTRGPVTGTQFDNGERINIILLDADAGTSSYGVMMDYVCSRPSVDQVGTWIPDATEGLMVRGALANVYAHYPGSLSGTNSLSSDMLTLTPVQSDTLDLGRLNASQLYTSFFMAFDKANPTKTSEVFCSVDDIDFMTGAGGQVTTKTVGGGTKRSAISMLHAKAMVVVYFYKDSALNSTDELTTIQIRNTPTGTAPLKRGTFSLTDNTFTPASANAETAYCRTMVGFPAGLHYSMFVFPAQMAAGDVQLEIVVGKTRYTMAMPAKKWEAGKVYTYNVRQDANGVTLDGAVDMYDWPDAIEHNLDLE